MNPEAVSWAFSKMMFLGNVHGALNFLSRNTSGLPLKLEDVIHTKEGTTESVLNILESLHPEGKPWPLNHFCPTQYSSSRSGHL